MTNEKKKGMPPGTPIPTKDYGTTPGSKAQWLAQILFEAMETIGKPMKRPKNPSVDRAFRQLIAEANKKGDCIINNGTGYYRPDADNEIDEYAYRLYRSKELARARDILNKIESMDKAFYGRYE